VGAITHEAHIPGTLIGAIQINDDSATVEVRDEVADAVVRALGEATVRGRRLKVWTKR
jgi:hypothetical protein